MLPDIIPVMAAMDGAIGLTDDRGILLYANRAFSEKFRCDPGDDFVRFLVDAASVRDRLRHLRVHDVVRCSVKNSLGLFWLRMTRIDTDGTPIFLAEAKEENSGSRVHRFMMDQLEAGFWEFDVQNNILRVTETWQRLRGIEADFVVDVSSQDWINDIHPEDRAHLLNSVDAQHRGDLPLVNIQYRHSHPTREWVWIQCRAIVLETNSDNKPTRIIGVDTEISEMKHREAEAEQLAHKLDLAMDIAGIGVWEFNVQNNTVTWDDRILDIYGITDGQHVRDGSCWAGHLHPDDHDEVVAYSEECDRLNLDFVRDFRILREDGEIRHLRSLARRTDAPFLGERLIGVNIDITDHMLRAEELEKARAKLEFDARHDALTGLGNRRFLDNFMEELPNRIAQQSQIAIAALDLDYFKDLNDKLGHAAGDAALVHVADILRTMLPKQAQAFRVGGDEFTLVLTAPSDAADTQKMCERIVEELSETFTFEGQGSKFGGSIGFAYGTGQNGRYDALFSNADAALYAAKQDGRSRVCNFADIQDNARLAPKPAQHPIRAALDAGRFDCVFQPQFAAQSLHLCGAKVQLRLHDDRAQSVLSNTTEAGLLAGVNRAVVNAVIALQTQWHTAGVHYPVCSVEVSADWLRGRDVLAHLTGQLQGHHKLCFQLAADTGAADIDDALRYRLDALRDAGIAIAIGGFYGSVRSVHALRAVRPDQVIVNRHLVAELNSDPAGRDILGAFCAAATSAAASVVLDGIDNDALLQTASRVDGVVLQGAALAAPMTSDRFEDVLRGKARALSA